MKPIATITVPCPQCEERVTVTTPELVPGSYQFDFRAGTVTTDYCGCELTEEEIADVLDEAERRSLDGHACSGGFA